MNTPRIKPAESKPSASKAARTVPVDRNPATMKAAAAAAEIKESTRELTICVGGVGARRAADKSVSYADHGFDAVATGFQLLPQPADVNIQRTGVAVITVTPNLIE